jgi:hypothetical protein
MSLSTIVFEEPWSVPSSVRTAGERWFAYCQCLREVALKSGVETIGCGCFGCCDSLVIVVFEDSCCVSVIEGSAVQRYSSLASFVFLRQS